MDDMFVLESCTYQEVTFRINGMCIHVLVGGTGPDCIAPEISNHHNFLFWPLYILKLLDCLKELFLCWQTPFNFSFSRLIPFPHSSRFALHYKSRKQSFWFLQCTANTEMSLALQCTAKNRINSFPF